MGGSIMANFSDEFLNNKALTDTCFGFNPLLAERIGNTEDSPRIQTGALIQKNGDILFRVYAPTAKTVEVDIKILYGEPNLALQKNEDGMFEGVLPFNSAFCGPRAIDYIIDGVVVLHPYTPIYYCYGRPVNYIEIPDPETDYILLRDVPHGSVNREIYYSKAMDDWERCLVYTPPGYQDGGVYPVLYLQHGHTENEITWTYNGKLPYILDNLLAEGKCMPFIVVMNDGMTRRKEESDFYFGSFESMILDDCRSFIEKTYHVKTDKWSRAMAGLSMGSIQTSMFGLSHPELFGYLGIFSGFVCLPTEGGTSPEKNPYLSIICDHPEQFEKEYKVFFRSMGDKDNVFEFFAQDDAFCEKNGLDKLPNYIRKIYPDVYHDWGAWRRAICDFAQLIFK